ncbi:flagellar protein FliS [Lachnospiraceae bacterium ZAX-1]
MDKEQRQEFTRRISCSNKSELVVITYDIIFVYLDEAAKAHQDGVYESFKEAIKKAQAAIIRLSATLDFQYPIACELFPIYQYANQKLSEAIYKDCSADIENVKGVLKNLYDGFTQVAIEDSSEPLMQHTQQVVAGMTYQKGSLTETYQDSDHSRGFFA